MFSIYMINYLDSSGNLVTNAWNKVLEIPITDSYNKWMVAPSIKADMGKAESFDFQVNPNSDYYNAFVELKTLMQVKYGDDIIFHGRVVTVSTSGLLEVRSIHAEGLFAVLRDSYQEGIEEDKIPKTPVLDRLEGILSTHNSFYANTVDAWKQIALDRSIITAEFDRNETRKLASTSWQTSIDALNDLVSKYGGYMRVTYGSNGTPYLDWKSNYFRDLGDGQRPHIEIAKNLIDLSKASEVSEIFTRVIPIGTKTVTSTKSDGSSSGSSTSSASRYVYIGSQKWFSVTQLCDQSFSGYTREQLNSGFHSYEDYANAENNYGVIFKVLNFSNADNADTLKTYALDWVKKNYYGALKTFNVKAIDMHMIGENSPRILIGDCVDITYPTVNQNGIKTTETRKLVCKAIQYNLFNPEQNTYTLGIPSDLLDFEYGEKKKKGGGKSNSAGVHKNTEPKNEEKSIEFNWHTIAHWIDNYYYVWPEKYPNTPIPTFARYAYPGGDRVPYNSFVENGEMDYDGYFYYDYNDGKGHTSGKIVGRYQTWNGHDYGVCVAAGIGTFTINWSSAISSTAGHYQIQFIFPALKGIYEGGIDTGTYDIGNFIIDPETGNTVWVNSEGKTAAEVSAEHNNASFGYADEGKWYIKLNDTVSYVDTDPSSPTYGQTVTKDGFVTADDFSCQDIPSFKTKIAVVDQLIAAKATIGELRAYEALLGDYSGATFDADGNITSFDGTGLKANMDQIQGVSGKFEIDANGDFIVKDGGSFYVRRDGVNLGLMDEGKLGGGFNVSYTEDPVTHKKTYTTTVAGNYVMLGNNIDPRLVNETLNDFASDAANRGGVFADYLVVRELRSQEITTMLANIDDASIENLTVTTRVETGILIAYDELRYGNTGSTWSVLDVTKNPNNANELIIKRINGSTIETVTFSKATSLSGSWSGNNTFRVTAIQSGTVLPNPYTITFNQQNDLVNIGSPAVNSASSVPRIVQQSMYLYYTDNNGQRKNSLAVLDAKIAVENFLESRIDNPITENGTYTPSGNNLGFKSVKVNCYPNTASLTRAMTGVNSSGVPVYYGTLYYKTGDTYGKLTNSNYYWYYSTTPSLGTVHY